MFLRIYIIMTFQKLDSTFQGKRPWYGHSAPEDSAQDCCFVGEVWIQGLASSPQHARPWDPAIQDAIGDVMWLAQTSSWLVRVSPQPSAANNYLIM